MLYNEFLQDTERVIFNGYNGRLVDGICDDGFDPANLERKYGRTFGYYLHLHGTPVVYDESDQENVTIRKKKYNTLTSQWSLDEHISRHIVLTHEKFKTGIIDESLLLKAYWEYFKKSLTETKHLVILGYSGNDTHINETLSIHLPSTSKVTVVERQNPLRNEQFWNNELSYLENGEKKERHIRMKTLENILSWDFTIEES